MFCFSIPLIEFFFFSSVSFKFTQEFEGTSEPLYHTLGQQCLAEKPSTAEKEFRRKAYENGETSMKLEFFYFSHNFFTINFHRKDLDGSGRFAKLSFTPKFVARPSTSPSSTVFSPSKNTRTTSPMKSILLFLTF